MTWRLRKVAELMLVSILLGSGPALAATGYFVNGVEVNKQEQLALEHQYGIRIDEVALTEAQRQRVKEVFGIDIDGRRFWYDNVSGAWGYEGLPAAGVILPGLPINAPLQRDASGGDTNVLVNGRALHPTEVRYLAQHYGQVLPGDYYLLADGTYGFVGGLPIGRIQTAKARGAGGSQSRFGRTLGDGNGFLSFTSPQIGGRRGVGVTCAPDGGCIYH